MEYKKTTFLGVEIKNGPNDLIKKALGSSLKHLTIEQFMEVINFERDPTMTDYFWQIMVEKQHSHLSSLLLQCLGYEGKGFTQQQAIKRFLKSNNIQPLELSSDDPRVNTYESIKEEMKTMIQTAKVEIKRDLAGLNRVAVIRMMTRLR